MLRRTVHRLFAGASVGRISELKAQRKREIERLPEYKQVQSFFHELKSHSCGGESGSAVVHLVEDGIATKEQVLMALDAAILTYALHYESRMASLVGEGFYTIGPCGEELLSPLGLILNQGDPVALHYRHLAVSIARQLQAGNSIECIMLNRARGYVVAASDPVAGGGHCCLGGSKLDYVVTSTLASQTPPAVGRAMGGILAKRIGVPCPFGDKFVSFVSVGDGSIHNGHFLSAQNLADFATHLRFKVPTVFCITDNGLSISFKTHNYVMQQFIKNQPKKVFKGNAMNMMDVWRASHNAIQSTRESRSPSLLVLHNITRRFGHAATDRQPAYLTNNEINVMASTCPLRSACAEIVHSHFITYDQLYERAQYLFRAAADAFDQASLEKKITSRDEILNRNAAPLVPVHAQDATPGQVFHGTAGISTATSQVMRMHMRATFDEILRKELRSIYIGEDVVHGGYYLVTEGLAAKHPLKIHDFPPDETTLLGAAMGYAQAGMVPIVEIPYGKYLDCGFDMFGELALTYWLSNGREKVGMIVRLQGFDRGMFGGNFHTHNVIHIPVGIDVVCCSNGPQYAKMMRYAFEQAKNGRITMFVDCTHLLNLRKFGPKETKWEFQLTESREMTPLDNVTIYGTGTRTAIVTYGNGVVLAQEAMHAMEMEGITDVAVIDSPLLSEVGSGLESVCTMFDSFVFADICKEGQHPLSSHVTSLINKGKLPPGKFRCVAAPRTYNPLGNMLSFLSVDDIKDAVKAVRAE